MSHTTDTAAEEHLAVLSKLARSLMRDDFTAGLRQATTADEVLEIVRGAILKDDVAIRIDVMESEKRPVSAVSDQLEVRDIASVVVSALVSLRSVRFRPPEKV